jgi:hypothetical protein
MAPTRPVLCYKNSDAMARHSLGSHLTCSGRLDPSRPDTHGRPAEDDENATNQRQMNFNTIHPQAPIPLPLPVATTVVTFAVTRRRKRADSSQDQPTRYWGNAQAGVEFPRVSCVSRELPGWIFSAVLYQLSYPATVGPARTRTLSCTPNPVKDGANRRVQNGIGRSLIDSA